MKMIDLKDGEWSTTQAAKMFKVPCAHVSNWIADGRIPATRKGKNNKLDICGMLAVGLHATFRRQGHSLASLTPASEFLRSISPADLLEAVCQGRTLLVTFGELFPPALVSPRAGILDDVAVASAEKGLNPITMVCDIGRCLRQIADATPANESKELIAQ